MNELEYVPVPAFEDNYIWLVSNSNDAIVVDPGEAAPVSRYLDERGWRLTAILLTHHHGDHVGGVAELLKRWPVPVYGPACEAIPTVTQPVGAGDWVQLALPTLAFEVLEVPGHTRGHLAYFQPSDTHGTPHLFCGDTLFSCGCGRLFEGTPVQMLASLDTLAALPGRTLVHCAHEYTLSNIRFALACEPDNMELMAWCKEAAARRARGEPTLPTTIAHERAVNPFLRLDQPAVRATLAAQGQHEIEMLDRLAIFTQMRKWKNCF